MFIYDFSCLNLVSVPSTIHFLDCHLALEFCTAYVGLITFGGNCASPGIVFVRYAPYICALQVRYARYTRSPQWRSLLRFEFARHFESHLARPPPFYRRMRKTISDEHSIARTLRNARIIFSTYSFNWRCQLTLWCRRGKLTACLMVKLRYRLGLVTEKPLAHCTSR